MNKCTHLRSERTFFHNVGSFNMPRFRMFHLSSVQFKTYAHCVCHASPCHFFYLVFSNWLRYSDLSVCLPYVSHEMPLECDSNGVWAETENGLKFKIWWTQMCSKPFQMCNNFFNDCRNFTATISAVISMR